MARRRKPRLHPDQYLDTCFGKQVDELRENCPCPPLCKKLCKRTGFQEHNAPWMISSYGGKRPYVAIPNSALFSWGEREPRPATKLVYAGLIAYAMRSNWIVDRTEVVAKKLGFQPKQFSQHCAALEGLGLIARYPARKLLESSRSNHKVILLRSQPEWFPGYLSEKDIADYLRRKELGSGSEDAEYDSASDDADELADEDDGEDLDDLEPDEVDEDDAADERDDDRERRHERHGGRRRR